MKENIANIDIKGIRYKITMNNTDIITIEECQLITKLDIQVYSYDYPIVFYRGGRYHSINPRNISSIQRIDRV